MKKIIILLGLIGFMVMSCEDELTIFPEDSLSVPTFFQTEEDFTQAINGTYAPLRSLYDREKPFMAEMSSDNTYFARNTAFGATETNQDIADHSMITEGGITPNGNVQQLYRDLYSIIARANQILFSIDEAEFDEATKANIKGQALFLRAFAYFDLVQFFFLCSTNYLFWDYSRRPIF